MTDTAMTLTARNPEDLLAMVPVVLGFVPHASVVMLTFGADRAFHARVDLPDDPVDLPDLVPVLLEPARHHGVRRVVLLAYTSDLAWAETVTGVLRHAFHCHDIEVLGRIAADGLRWWALPRESPEDPGTGYDVSAHPFLVEAVLHGIVTLGSRAEVAATLSTDPVAAAEVARLVAGLVGVGPPAPRQRAAEATWAATLVRRCTTLGIRPDAGEVARLLAGLRDLVVRDAAWLTLSRADATAHVEFWRDVVRRSPADLLAAPAAILGFAAWLAGQGALAWCAVDRSREADPDYSLAGLLADALTSAVPPSSWEVMDVDTGPGPPARGSTLG